MKKQKLKVLITSGGTREKIDPVRFIGNFSSGKMGAALAAEFARVAEVLVVSAPVGMEYSAPVVWVESADEMLVKTLENLPADIFIAAAAVADKRPANYSAVKIKKENFQSIELVDNADIVATVANGRLRPSLVVAFAAESENHVANARAKLTKKSCDLVVVNDISALGSDENEVWLVGENFEKKIPRGAKQEIAKIIVKEIMEIYAGQHQN